MTTDVLIAALVVLVLGNSAVLFYMLKKVRGIDYRVGRGAERANVALYRQVQALLALEQEVGLGLDLPPLRAWPASPDFLVVLVRRMKEQRPATIVDLGSGASTLVLATMAKKNGIGHVYSVENDSNYAVVVRRDIGKCGLGEWATVIDAPLAVQTVGSERCNWYTLDGLPAGGIDFLVIDGPQMADDPMLRYPAGPVLFPRLNPGAAVFLDDAARPGEKIFVERWRQEFPDLRYEKISCEKGCVALYRE